MATVICVARCRILFRVDLTRFGIRTLTNDTLISSLSSSFRHSSFLCHLPNETQQTWSRRVRKYCTKSEKESHEEESSEVTVKYIQGLPHLTVPLPSRNEKCRFALKPVSHNVGDLINMLKSEDRGIDRAAVLNTDGIRIASTCTIESLMDEPFWLHINDKKYKVIPPKREKITSEELTKLGDVKAVVAQLYEALHVGEYHIKKEKELLERLENLRYQLAPLEEQKSELDAKAVRKTNIMTWVGLGLMSVQFGILARLTWWEYSWDIMEPVTYFVTYGTAMAAYAYYCITKQEYNYPDVRDRQYLITIHKRAKKKGFDVHTYNYLKREIAGIEYDLRRLRDPLNLQLPPHLEKSIYGPSSVSGSLGGNNSLSESTIAQNSDNIGSRSTSIKDNSKTNQSKFSKFFNAAKKLKK